MYIYSAVPLHSMQHVHGQVQVLILEIHEEEFGTGIAIQLQDVLGNTAKWATKNYESTKVLIPRKLLHYHHAHFYNVIECKTLFKHFQAKFQRREHSYTITTFPIFSTVHEYRHTAVSKRFTQRTSSYNVHTATRYFTVYACAKANNKMATCTYRVLTSLRRSLLVVEIQQIL